MNRETIGISQPARDAMLRWCGLAGMLGGIGLVVAPAVFVATGMPPDAYQSRWRWTMTHDDIMAFKAPGWATDWCNRCGWESTCTDCRVWR